MPRLIRLYLSSMMLGAVLGVIFAVLLVAFDIAGLRHLLFASPAGLIGFFMLIFFHAALFAGVQFGISVMLMAEGGRKPPSGRVVFSNISRPKVLVESAAGNSDRKNLLPDSHGN